MPLNYTRKVLTFIFLQSAHPAFDLVPYSIMYNSRLYATLDATPPSTTAKACQDANRYPDGIRIPAGWIVAARDLASEQVAKTHPWGTLYLIIGDGGA